MGVKSTQEMTREQAERRYAEILAEVARNDGLKLARGFSNQELEDHMEAMNDLRAGGEGFENYLITDGY